MKHPLGREEEKQRLQQACETARNQRGQTIILSGKNGSGRYALATWLQQWVYNRGGATELVKLADENLRAYRQSVRRAAREQREKSQLLLLVVDQLEQENSVWLDELERLAAEIRDEYESLPALLLITLTTPIPPEELTGEQHTEFTRFAQKVVRDNLATPIHLSNLSLSQIQESIKPADPDLGDRLYTLTEGDPYWVAVIWEEWVAVGAVVQNEQDVWEENPDHGQVDKLPVYGDVADWARNYLDDLLTAWEDQAPFTLDETERILNCAAVEGVTFTAEAVAAVLNLDRDDLIDLFDDFLAPYTDPDNPVYNEPGIVTTVRPVHMDPVQPRRHVWEYRFTRPFLYYVWRNFPHLPAREKERNQWPLFLATELEKLYYPYAHLIVDKLHYLSPTLAEPYRRRQQKRVSLEILRYQVNMLQIDDLSNKYIAYRLFDIGFQLLGRLATERPGAWEEGRDLGRTLQELAQQWEDIGYEAKASRYLAYHLHNGGQYEDALPQARHAVNLCKECHLSQQQLAGCSSDLGSLLSAMGDYAAARPYFERALAIHEEVLGPDHPHTASSLNNLGLLLDSMGDYAAARPYFERALAIFEEKLGPDHPNTKIVRGNLQSLPS